MAANAVEMISDPAPLILVPPIVRRGEGGDRLPGPSGARPCTQRDPRGACVVLPYGIKAADWMYAPCFEME